jgi:hypothetical protein
VNVSVWRSTLSGADRWNALIAFETAWFVLLSVIHVTNAPQRLKGRGCHWVFTQRRGHAANLGLNYDCIMVNSVCSVVHDNCALGSYFISDSWCEPFIIVDSVRGPGMKIAWGSSVSTTVVRTVACQVYQSKSSWSLPAPAELVRGMPFNLIYSIIIIPANSIMSLAGPATE